MTSSHSRLIPNITVMDQIGELDIRCRHGLEEIEVEVEVEVADGAGSRNGGSVGVELQLQLVPDPNGCQETIKLDNREDHESVCGSVVANLRLPLLLLVCARHSSNVCKLVKCTTNKPNAAGGQYDKYICTPGNMYICVPTMLLLPVYVCVCVCVCVCG